MHRNIPVSRDEEEQPGKPKTLLPSTTLLLRAMCCHGRGQPCRSQLVLYGRDPGSSVAGCSPFGTGPTSIGIHASPVLEPGLRRFFGEIKENTWTAPWPSRHASSCHALSPDGRKVARPAEKPASRNGASGFEPEGRRFESFRAHTLSLSPVIRRS